MSVKLNTNLTTLGHKGHKESLIFPTQQDRFTKRRHVSDIIHLTIHNTHNMIVAEITMDDKDDILKDLLEGDQDYASAVGWQPENGVVAKMLEEYKKKNPRSYSAAPDLLFARPVSHWLSIGRRLPPQPHLFGPLWLVGELCILFARTGAGKSVLAMQIAESLARGVPIPPFDREAAPRVPPQRVLFIDFELDCDQLAMRYSRISEDRTEFDAPYEFSSHFFRAEMSWNGNVQEGYDGFSDMFFTCLDEHVRDSEATVLVIDNITFLDTSATSNVSVALNVMRRLVELKKYSNISILVLAHTPKRRASHPLTEHDLQGSINIANFADSMFAMETSRTGTDVRYLKQIKTRTGRKQFGHTNVAAFSLQKFDFAAAQGIVQNIERPPFNNFLGMKFKKFNHENDHLEFPQQSRSRNRSLSKDKASVIENAKRLATEGKSSRKIAKELNISRMSAARYVQMAKETV